MKSKRIPLRKCVACNEKKNKNELVRIVKKNDETVEIDLLGKTNGRGAYLCKNLECINKAEESKKLSRALKIEVSKDIYEDLKKLTK